jgi:hypothetical protein
MSNHFSAVMAVPGVDPGIVPAIYVLSVARPEKDVGAHANPRIKSGDGHDTQE